MQQPSEGCNAGRQSSGEGDRGSTSGVDLGAGSRAVNFSIESVESWSGWRFKADSKQIQSRVSWPSQWISAICGASSEYRSFYVSFFLFCFGVQLCYVV